MDNQWFYIRQWKQQAWERLLEHRTVRVCWEADDGDQRETLPQFVKIPDGIDLTNEGIGNYLSDTFGWLVHDWSVAQRRNNEPRI